MQNFPLLREVGRFGLPVLLKRHWAATLTEWLCAAEYIAAEGNLERLRIAREIAGLTWEQADSPENNVLFDLSSRGTLKLVSTIAGLDTRDSWVQDVDRIEVEIR